MERLKQILSEILAITQMRSGEETTHEDVAEIERLYNEAVALIDMELTLRGNQ